MFKNFTEVLGTGEGMPPAAIVLNLLLSFILSVFIGVMYKKNHRGLSYSQSLIFSFVLLSVTTSSVIMVIGNNLARAFGLVGALSIIRFRTVVKDTKDTSYVFFSLALGMATGTGSYALALISTVIFAIVDSILTATNFGSIRKHEYIVRFAFNPKKQTDDAYKNVFERFLAYAHLVDVTVVSDDSVEYSYNIQLLKDADLSQYISELKKMEGVSHINLVTAKMDVEY